MPESTPLYRGRLMTLAELIAHPAGEGVGFNLQGDGDNNYLSPSTAFWTLNEGQPVGVGRVWSRRETQPIRIIVPRGTWNPAEEVLPPVGSRVSVTTLAAFGPYANGVVIAHVGEVRGNRWRLVYQDYQPDTETDPCFEFHPVQGGGRIEFVPCYTQQEYEIVSHPAQRYVPTSAAVLASISPENPGCPVCLRNDVFYEPESGRYTTYRPGLTLGAHLRERRRGAPRCNVGDTMLRAVRDMFHCFVECPRCNTMQWRHTINNGMCSDCRSRRGTIQRVGAKPEQLRFGSELETEGISYNRQAGDIAGRKKGWTAKPDGSLRGQHAEVTTPPLWFTEQGIKDYQDAVRELRRAGARATKRCGGHVHVGLEDLTYAQLGSIIEWWWLMEPAVLAALPPWGTRATYCRPMAEGARRAALACVNNQDRGGFANLPCDRYVTLNNLSLQRYGTFEFRFFNGTVHAVKATANVALVVNLVSHASRNVLLPMQTEIPRFTRDREGMVKVLDTIGIENPAWRWHLLGEFQTEADRPHGARPDLAEKMEKKRNLPPTPRRVRNYAMVLTAAEANALGLDRCTILESTYASDRVRTGTMQDRVARAVEWCEENAGGRLDSSMLGQYGVLQPDMLVAVPFRNWDRAVQLQEQRTRDSRINNEVANAP